MAINPIELNGTISRLQDYSSMKQNEDQKGALLQNALEQEQQKEEAVTLEIVHNKEDVDNEGKRPDAKEKGNGEYSGDGGQKRHGKDKEKEEEVHKSKDGKKILMGSFDIKI
ncbi:MAG: hypothetical protein K6A92_04225 [Lachnospiraceae bacterium]|nr:hypothetical protein [Lachnospiraceae bacterium]